MKSKKRQPSSHGTSSLFTTSHWVPCDGCHVSFRYSHRQAQNIGNKSSADSSRLLRDQSSTVATFPYSYFSLSHVSDTPTQIYGWSVCRGTSNDCKDLFIHFQSSNPLKISKSMDHSALSDEHFTSCETEHDTALNGVLPAKHDNVSNDLVGAVLYKPHTDWDSQIDKNVGRKQHSIAQ